MDRDAVVYMDYPSGPVLVGRLWSRIRKGRESASFEYDAGWLARADRFALEPSLMLAPGPYHAGADRPMFGAIGDSAPDRWGRMLMRRAERKAAQRENRAPRTLFEMDFLLLVDDEVRAGALRFSNTEGGPFLAEPGKFRIPPIVELNRLLSATERVIEDKETEEDLRLLIAPGSSLGGARPKASVRDAKGRLAIAKFPHRDDSVNVVLWEGVALTLAARAGIAVPEWRVESVANRAALVLARFDRKNGTRLPFVSAMSMLSAADNEPHSYLEIAEALRQYGAAPNEDLRHLWRRVVFNVLISNSDDHLRNHGFLYEGPKGWRLSPAYDMNPVPLDVKPRVLSTSIDPDDPSASIDLAFGVADYFGLKDKEARAIASEIAAVVSDWKQVAEKTGLTRAEIDRMASAFEHDDLDKARAAA
ncbi:MAG TPA: type II toxin-antitoxin system HipA family toxin [Candidatus Acidoferrum sp.]